MLVQWEQGSWNGRNFVCGVKSLNQVHCIEKTMNQIIIIALEFPPLNTAGSVRPFRMAEYFGAQGVDVTVMTMSKDRSLGMFQKPNNLELSSDQFKTVEIIPSFPEANRKSKIRQWFSVGDYYEEVWGGDLHREIQHYIKKQGKPDFILGTCPPFSTATLTRRLSQHFDVPYILDLRDAWSQWNINPQTTYWHYKSVLREERQCIEDSHVTLTTTNQTKADLLRLHGKDLNLMVVENGFDKDIEFLTESSWTTAGATPLVIGYVGSFYFNPGAHEAMFRPWWRKSPHRWFHYAPRKEDWTYRSPRYFFQILRELFDKYPDWREKLRLEFVGRVPEWLTEMIQEFDLGEHVTLRGQVSLEESLRLQQSFDFFLGTSAKIEGQSDYSMGSKYYEALQFQKPIIGVCGPSPLAELIEKSGLGVVLDPNHARESARELHSFLQREKVSVDGVFLSTKARKQQLKALLEIL